MRPAIVIFVAVILAMASFAQPKLNVDSLRKLLAVTSEDTTAIILTAQISGELTFYKPDSAFKLAKLALLDAEEINFRKGEFYCKTSLARYWWTMGNYSVSINLLLDVVKNADLKTDRWLSTMVGIYLVAAYRDLGDYREALQYSLRFTSLEEKYDQCKLCRSWHAATASIYLEMEKADSALLYLRKAFNHKSIFGDDGWMYMIAGRTHGSVGNYDSAYYFYREAIPKLIEEENQKDLAGAYNSLASQFAKFNQPDSAFIYAFRALDISKSKQYSREFMMTNLLLSQAYERINSDSALYYHKSAMVAKDTIYNQEKQRQILGYKFNEELSQQEIKNKQTQYRNSLKIYALITALTVFAIILVILYRNNSQKQKAKIKIEEAYKELKATQAQLIQSEKMASLGELTAGIAHEIQNPLNFVNNFSDISNELIEEMKNEMTKGNHEEANAIVEDVKQNLEKINHHGKRADAIVKGMLQHSRSSSGKKESTDINALADEYLRLAYHGMRAKDKSFNVATKTDFDDSIGKINVVPQDIGRVILNLINNAFYAVSEKKKSMPPSPKGEQGAASLNYEPVVTITTKRLGSRLGDRGKPDSYRVEIRVADNGNGIPQKVLDKIFQPFFTTKPTGQGTGLGLSLSYDIVKAHGGEIKVETEEGEGTELIIQLPV